MHSHSLQQLVDKSVCKLSVDERSSNILAFFDDIGDIGG